MPVNPEDLEDRKILSGDYHEEKVFIDFYTNNTIRIYRADPEAVSPDDDAAMKGQEVWLDNLEKQELQEALNKKL